MDLSLVAVHPHPSLPIRLAVLFLLAYPFVAWQLSSYRTGVGPIAASAVPLALTPLLIGAGMGWLGITRVFEVMAIAGGGHASRAAGFSEIFVMIAFSSAISGLVTGIAWFRDAIRRSHQQTERQPAFRRANTLAGILTALALASLVGQVVMARQTVYSASAPAPVSPKFAAVVGLVCCSPVSPLSYGSSPHVAPQPHSSMVTGERSLCPARSFRSPFSAQLGIWSMSSG